MKDVAHHVVEGFNDDVSSKLQGMSVTWSHARAYSSIIDDNAQRLYFAVAAMCVTIALITIKTRSIIIGIGGALSIAGAAIFTHATYFCIWTALVLHASPRGIVSLHRHRRRRRLRHSRSLDAQ